MPKSAQNSFRIIWTHVILTKERKLSVPHRKFFFTVFCVKISSIFHNLFTLLRLAVPQRNFYDVGNNLCIKNWFFFLLVLLMDGRLGIFF